MQVDWGQVGIGAGGIRWGIGKEEEIRKRQLNLGDIWVAACTSRSGHFLESIRITLMRTPSNSRNSLNWPSFLSRQVFQQWDWVIFGWVVDQGGPTEIPTQLKLMLGQKATLWKLTGRPYCWQQHQHSSLNIERLSWCLRVAFTPPF